VWAVRWGHQLMLQMRLILTVMSHTRLDLNTEERPSALS